MVDGDLAQAWAFKKLTERDISDLFECFRVGTTCRRPLAVKGCLGTPRQ